MTRRLARLALVVGLPWTAGACDTLSAVLFGVAPPANPDLTAPLLTDPHPAADVEIVSSDVFTILATDVGSGINPARVQAQVIGLVPVPTTVLLPVITIHLGSVPDGPIQVAVVAEDFAGNSAAYVFTTHLDREAPTLAFPAPPDPSITTSVPTRSMFFTVQVGADPNFAEAQVEVLSPGADGTCGTSDDADLPATEVAAPVRTFSAPGIHPVTFFLNNPVDPLGQPTARLYCWVATASDLARTLDGEEGANTSRLVDTTLITWNPPPPQ